jgi:hypothetical protein
MVHTRQDGPVQHVGVGEEDVAVAAPRRALGVGRVAVVGAGAHGAAQQPGSSTEAAAKIGRAAAAAAAATGRRDIGAGNGSVLVRHGLSANLGAQQNRHRWGLGTSAQA